jgi:hypothetical protein
MKPMPTTKVTRLQTVRDCDDRDDRADCSLDTKPGDLPEMTERLSKAVAALNCLAQRLENLHDRLYPVSTLGSKLCSGTEEPVSGHVAAHAREIASLDEVVLRLEEAVHSLQSLG